MTVAPIPSSPDPRQLEGAVAMFDALSDLARLKTLLALPEAGSGVSALARAVGEKVTTVSARLHILHAARLVVRERKGKNVIYRLADDHVLTLVRNAVAHASEMR